MSYEEREEEKAGLLDLPRYVATSTNIQIKPE
jgi:hypothetical protein